MPRVPLDCSLSAADAIRALGDEPHLVALVGDWAGGGALLTSRPLELAGDPIAALSDRGTSAPPTASALIGGGWFGWLGVEVAHQLEQLPSGPPRPHAFPTAQLGRYDHVVRRDIAGVWWLEAVDAEALDQHRDRVAGQLASAPRRTAARLAPLTLPRPAAHLRAVADGIEAIRAGELFQANLCCRWDTHLTGRPADAFAGAIERLPAPRAALSTSPDGHALLSLSPELFLERTDRRVRSAPIKGTAPAGEDAALTASTKDRAENVMIVDLVRNDLGRVARTGTVQVDALAVPQQMAGVTHLVSEVSATLRDDVDDAQLVTAAFPPGSVTGAPKVQALKAIARLEQSGREAFTGAIGFAAADRLELNVAIRTLHVAPGGTAWLGTGGGVTAQSTPHGELDECVTKARPIARAFGADVVDPFLTSLPPRRVANALDRLGPQRPDPSKGVFTTLLVAGGHPHELELHLDRLRASVRELYDVDLPDDLAHGLQRLGTADLRARVHVRPDGTTRVTTRPLGVDPTAAPKRLVPFVLPGGLGAHKWADRRLLDALQDQVGPDATPLLLDGDGEVLEASYAAVLIVEDGTLISPPDDHRRLPSTSVRRLGDAVTRAPFSLERLRDADQVVLASAVRGPHAALRDTTVAV